MSMIEPYTSDSDHLAVHTTGWVDLPSGARITKLPIQSPAHHLAARLGWGEAEAWCKAHGYRLPTIEEYEELHAISIHVDPVTMPNADQLHIHSIHPDDKEAVRRFRNEWMRSYEWCLLHDGAMANRLAHTKWDGQQPVANWGKHISKDGILVGWWREDGTRIQQGLSVKPQHGALYTDYATTFHAVMLPVEDPDVELEEQEEPAHEEPVPETQPAAMMGLDISSHQPAGKFDWKLIATDVQFIIARACYGKKPDRSFVAHCRYARDRGIRVGGYVFFRQQQRWQQQFETLQKQISAAGIGPGDILPAVDLEANKFDGPMDPLAHNTVGRDLVEAVAEHWGGCIVYLNPNHYNLLGEPKWVLDHHIWVAHWDTDEPAWPHSDWAIWQKSSTYRHPGFSGLLDLNEARKLPTIK